MNLVQIIATLRKFGNYLAGLFPALVIFVDFFSKLLRRIVENPVIEPYWQRLCENKTAQAFWKLLERFYWRTYSKDRLDLQEAPPATLAILRPIFQICAFLCILIPLTQFPLYPVQVEAFSGFTGTAPSWSVLLWLLCLPFAWAALLTGAAISNRISFCICAIGAANFVSTCVLLLPRNYFNLLLPFSIFVALALCERTLPRATWQNKTLSLLNSVITGIVAAIPLVILTPLRPWLATFIQLPGPVISIGGGAILGTVLGLIIWGWSRLPEKPDRPMFLRGGQVSFSACVWTIVVCLTMFLLAGVARGDLGQSGGLLLSSLALTTSYFWPIWYFIGIGILHKLMGSSKVVASAIEGLFPPVLLTPLLVLLLITALLISFSESISLYLVSISTTSIHPLFPPFLKIYEFSKPFIWSQPLNVITVHWLSWVLLFDAFVVLILAVRRRITSAAMVRLLFLTSLATLLISEYVFQLSSFARPPRESVIALFLFATWLLWLMHTVGWSLSTRSTPCWPSAGRLAIYGGIATIALLDIHARSAAKDFKLMNELFLTMFRGVIDVGLPYYFLVWTSKRIETVPVKISTLLGLFSLGALVSFAFNVLEKLSSCAWSLPELKKLADAQYQQMQSTGSPNIDLAVPIEFFAVRAVVYVGLMSVVFLIARTRLNKLPAPVLFTLVAFASGIAAFSKTLLELPIPNEWRALIAPSWQELSFTCNLFQAYLAYWIPALILGLAQMGKKSNAKMFFIVAPVAVATNFAISWFYSEFEVYLRACGSLYFAMAAIGGIFVLLVSTLLSKISHVETASPATLLSPRLLAGLIVVLEIILVPLTIHNSQLPLRTADVAFFDHQVTMPLSWVEQKAPDAPPNQQVITYARNAKSAGVSIFQIGTVPSDPAGTRELLKTLLSKAAESRQYPNLKVLSVEEWGRYCPNALACFFSYDTLGTNPLPRSGLSILLPRKNGVTEFFTIHTNPTDITRDQAELALTLQQVRKALQ